jgi:hypothetical protein
VAAGQIAVGKIQGVRFHDLQPLIGRLKAGQGGCETGIFFDCEDESTGFQQGACQCAGPRANLNHRIAGSDFSEAENFMDDIPIDQKILRKALLRPGVNCG